MKKLILILLLSTCAFGNVQDLMKPTPMDSALYQMQINILKYNEEKKDETAAGILGFFLPPVGLLYADEPILAIMNIAMTFMVIKMYQDGVMKQGAAVAYLLSIDVLSFGACVRVTQNWNKFLRKKYKIPIKSN